MLLIVRQRQGRVLSHHDRHDDIGLQLSPLGVAVGRIKVGPAGAGSVAAQVTDARALASLQRRFSIRSADRITVRPTDLRWPSLREQFRRRHLHDDHEIRIFVSGRGLFELPGPADTLAQLLCEPGDWLALPPATPHAFDAGEHPAFDALRLFSQPEGWVAHPTNEVDQAPLPDLDRFILDVQAGLRAAA